MYVYLGHKKSQNEFCSSHVSLIGANIKDETKLQIIWKCGKYEQQQICSMKKFVEYQGKSLGFDDLFPICVVEKSKYVKVTFNIFNKIQTKLANPYVFYKHFICLLQIMH